MNPGKAVDALHMALDALDADNIPVARQQVGAAQRWLRDE